MVLAFQPLSLSFSHVNYYVDMPVVSFFLLSILFPVVKEYLLFHGSDLFWKSPVAS